MATIKNTIALSDKMTPVLRNITTALSSTVNAMQAADGASSEAFVEARRNIMDAERALDSMQAELNDTTTAADKTAKGFTVMRGVVSHLASDLTMKLGRALKDTVVNAVKTASDLVEVQNVIDVTFGSASRDVSAWSKTTLDAYGLAELSSKKYSGTLGAMFKSAGQTAEATKTMSTNLTMLAGDMASFYNLATDDAFLKLQAGISGETEPLRRLGINMTVATLEAYALANGIDQTFDSMTEAQKQFIRYQYIMEATADAQGDFTRTQEQFANQQRLTSENFSELTAAMVSDFLPAMSAVLQALNSFMTYLKPIAPQLGIITAAMGLAVGVIVLVTAAQWALNAAMYANPIVWIIALIILYVGAITALILWVVKLWKEHLVFRVMVISAWNYILNFMDTVPIFFMKVMHGIMLAYEWLNNKVGGILENVINTSIDLFNGLLDVINKIFGTTYEAAAHVTFASTYKLKTEADSQARLDEITAAESAASAKAAERAAELEQYVKDEKTREQYQTVADARASETSVGSDSVLPWEDFGVLQGGKIDEVGKISEPVMIDEEDIKLLKDVASYEFVNKYTTLRPELNVTFGDVTETADVNQIIEAMEDAVENAYASSLITEEAG